MKNPQFVQTEESSKNKDSENLKTKKNNEKELSRFSENSKNNNCMQKNQLQTINSENEKIKIFKKLSCSSLQKSMVSTPCSFQKSIQKTDLVQNKALSPPSFKKNTQTVFVSERQTNFGEIIEFPLKIKIKKSISKPKLIIGQEKGNLHKKMNNNKNTNINKKQISKQFLNASPSLQTKNKIIGIPVNLNGPDLGSSRKLKFEQNELSSYVSNPTCFPKLSTPKNKAQIAAKLANTKDHVLKKKTSQQIPKSSKNQKVISTFKETEKVDNSKNLQIENSRVSTSINKINNYFKQNGINLNFNINEKFKTLFSSKHKNKFDYFAVNPTVESLKFKNNDNLRKSVDIRISSSFTPKGLLFSKEANLHLNSNKKIENINISKKENSPEKIDRNLKDKNAERSNSNQKELSHQLFLNFLKKSNLSRSHSFKKPLRSNKSSKLIPDNVPILQESFIAKEKNENLQKIQHAHFPKIETENSTKKDFSIENNISELSSQVSPRNLSGQNKTNLKISKINFANKGIHSSTQFPLNKFSSVVMLHPRSSQNVFPLTYTHKNEQMIKFKEPQKSAKNPVSPKHKNNSIEIPPNQIRSFENRIVSKTIKSISTTETQTQKILQHVHTFFENCSISEIGFPDFPTFPQFYQIEKIIGKGCFGSVYLATQLLTGLPVALKVIRKQTLKDQEINSKINQEITILKTVANQSHVVKLLEVFEDNSNMYLVLEYLPNGDLISFFKSKSLFSESKLRSFFAKIVLSVRNLHSASVIHRDIKMDNILLDVNFNPVLCDFGICSIYDPLKPIKDTSGTPAYLSPEVIRANGGVCFKSDVWSLGVLLYALTFGCVPFEGRDVQELYRTILVGRLEFPKEAEAISPELADLIAGMVCPSINRRFSVEQVLTHSWFQNSMATAVRDKQVEVAQVRKMEKLAKDQVIRFLNDLGFPIDFVCNNVKVNAFDHVTSCYQNLMRHTTGGGIQPTINKGRYHKLN